MVSEAARVRALFDRLVGAVAIPFPQRGLRLEAPDEQGVYVIYGPNGKVLHVGRTPKGRRGLRQRLMNHLHRASSFTQKYLGGEGDKLRARHSYRYIVVPDARLRALLEAYAVGCLCPAHLGLSEAIQTQ